MVLRRATGETSVSEFIDPFEDLPDCQMRRAAFLTFSPYIEGLAEIGLKPTEAAIIAFVHANPGCSQSDIVRSLGIKKTNLSPSTARLEGDGFLMHAVSSGRARALVLTDKGVKMYGRIAEHERAHDERFYGFIPGDVREILIEWSKRIRERALAKS